MGNTTGELPQTSGGAVCRIRESFICYMMRSSGGIIGRIRLMASSTKIAIPTDICGVLPPMLNFALVLPVCGRIRVSEAG
jgi:hypothetical protein